MMHVIQQTTEAEVVIRRGEITWLVKSLGNVIAGLSQSEEQYKSLASMVNDMSLLTDGEIGVADTPSKEERTLEDIIENGSVAQALEKNNKRVGPGLPFVA